MQHAKWSCQKCGHKEFDVGEARMAGGFWTRVFNLQNRKFSTVSCERCGYTEFYRGGRSGALENVFDFFVG